jgi:hypothetical protein
MTQEEFKAARETSFRAFRRKGYPAKKALAAATVCVLYPQLGLPPNITRVAVGNAVAQ